MEVHPEEGHKWYEMSNMHTRGSRINANVCTYTLLDHKIVQLIASAISQLEICPCLWN